MSKRSFTARLGRGLGAVVLVSIALVAASLIMRPVLERWAVVRIEAALDAALLPDVRLAGPMTWQLWPRPVLVLEGLAVSDDATPLISLGRIEVELDPGALRARQLVIERVVLQRPEIHLGPDGGRWLSVDAWRAGDERAADGVAPVVRQVVVRDGRIEVDATATLRVEGLNLQADMPVGPGRPGQVSMNADIEANVQGFSLTGRISQQAGLALATSGVRVRDTSLHFTGQADRLETLELHVTLADLLVAPQARARDLALALRAEGVGLGWHLDLALPELVLGADTLIATGLSGEAGFDDGKLRAAGDFRIEHLQAVAADAIGVEGAISITLDGLIDAAADFEGRVDYPIDAGTAGRVQAEGSLAMRLPHPSAEAGSIETELDTSAEWWPQESVARGSFAGRLDESQLDGNWRFDGHASRPLHVQLELDRLNLDAYLGETDPDGPPDFAPWRTWPLSAELTIGELRWRGLLTTSTRLSINSE